MAPRTVVNHDHTRARLRMLLSYAPKPQPAASRVVPPPPSLCGEGYEGEHDTLGVTRLVAVEKTAKIVAVRN
jgi:hypothetical protein